MALLRQSRRVGGPFREGKGTSFEGGVRVPFVARWPGRIPKGARTSEPAMTIDVLPTVARLAGAPLPNDRIIDGRDIWPLLGGERRAASPHDALYFYWGQELHAVRSGAGSCTCPIRINPSNRPETRAPPANTSVRRSSCRCSISWQIPARQRTWLGPIRKWSKT